VNNSTGFNETISTNLRVLDINESFPVFSTSLSCPAQGAIPAFDASLSVTAAVNAQVDAEVGFIVVGSIVPPQIEDLAFTTSKCRPLGIVTVKFNTLIALHGTIEAAFDIKGGVKGTFDTGEIPLFQGEFLCNILR
jgi:hypothetical protein